MTSAKHATAVRHRPNVVEAEPDDRRFACHSEEPPSERALGSTIEKDGAHGAE